MHNKTIGLVAHDEKKKDLIEWSLWNHKKIIKYNLVATGTTGKLIKQNMYERMFKEDEAPKTSLNITLLKSGPLGGDQQLGAMITNGEIDLLIFFWDPLSAHAHDTDVKALLRLTVVYNIPTACNRSTADFLISSPLFDNDEYSITTPNYDNYINRL